jgi:arsenite methyltransferase
MSALQFDDDMSRRIAATYTTPDVVEQRRQVLELLALQRGESVLDIGAGPGFLAAEMAEVVGSEGSVYGIDLSESMLAIAAEREPLEKSAALHFQTGGATELRFDDASFDTVTSTQVYEYVEDMPTALAEANRVLRPGGRILVLDTDWDSIVWRSREPDRMRRVLTVWDEHLADPHLPQRLTGLLGDAGFSVRSTTAIPMLNVGYDPRTYSAGLIGFISGFVAGRSGITQAETDGWRDELESSGTDYFFSVNRYVFVAAK